MKNIILKSAFIVLAFSFFSFPQMTKQDSIWIPLKFFIGEWTGTGEGEPGNGNYERSYKYILNKKYIEIKNKSTYPPTDRYPQGEVHEDIGYISYDKIRKGFILRQFHIEGFVNQYKLDSIYTGEKGRIIVFISESIENLPNGWRAKETYLVANDNEFTETFELADPGGEFENYTKVKLVRKDPH